MPSQRIFQTVACLLAAVVVARAQVTWTGASSADFGTSTNWSASLPTDGTANVVFSGTVSPAPILNSSLTINSLTYASGVSGFTLGNTAGAVLTIQSSLTHNSGSLQTIAAPLTLGSAFTFSGPGSQTFLRLDGPLTASNGFTASSGIYLEVRGGWTAGGTVTLQGSGTVIEFSNGTYTLANNFVNNASLSFGTGATTTINGVISGSGAVNFNSPVTLNAANTYTGATNIGPATVTIGATNALPTTASVTFFSSSSRLQLNANQTLAGITDSGSNGSIGIASGRVLTMNNASPVSLGAVIDGAGALIKTGSGTLTLSGANTFTGTTTISGGTLAISSDANLGAAPASATPGALTLSGGTLQSTSSLTLAANRGLALGSSGTILTDAGTTLTYAGVITGSGATLFKSGAGTLVLGGVNTHGLTTIQNGTVQLGVNGALPAGTSVSIQPVNGATATLDLNGTAQTLNGINFTGASSSSAGIVNIGAGGTLTLSNLIGYNEFNHPGGAQILGGTLQLGGDRIFNIGDSFSAPADLTVTSAIADGGNGYRLIKNGAGTLQLGGANTYSGNTTINNGRLQLGANNALPAASTVVLQAFFSDAATLDVGATSQTIGGLTFGGGSGPATNTVTMSSGGAITLGGNVLVDASSNPVGASIQDGTLNLGSVTRTFNIGDSTNAGSGPSQMAELSISSVVAGSGGVTKTGAGLLVLSGANTYTGPTTVNAGRVQLGFGGSLSASSSVNINATGAGTTAILDLGSSSTSLGMVVFGGAGATSTSTNQLLMGGGIATLTGAVTYDATNNPLGALIGSGVVVLNSTQPFNVGDSLNAQNDLMVSAAVQGAGGITKTGGGTLVLNSASNSFTGPLTVQGGLLSFNSIGDSATSAISLGSGATAATLRYMGSTPLVTARPLDLAGTTGGATLDAQGIGSVKFTGPVTASGAGAKTLTLAGNGFTPSEISGVIADNSGTNKTSLLKTGFNTWILSGANTFTGGVTVNGGTLKLGGTNALGSNDVTVSASSGSSSATLDLAGTSQTIGALTLGGAGVGAAASNNVVTGFGGTLTLGGNVIVSGANSPIGSTISAALPFAATNPFGGSLALGGATRTFDVAFSANAVTELTILSNITGGATEGVIKAGTGDLLLAGSSTYGGGTTVQTGSGALLLGTSSTLVSPGSINYGPVGRGTLTLQNGTTLGTGAVFTSFGSYEDDVVLHNTVAIANNVTLGAGHSHQTLELAGTVNAMDALTTIHLGSSMPLTLSGQLNAANAGTAVTFDSGASLEPGVAVMLGSIGANVASLTLDRAAMIFGSAGSLANTTNIKVTNSGYVGVGYSGADSPTAAALSARITAADKLNFQGTFGFDTAEFLGSPHLFTEALNFTGFGPGFSIGSVSSAILAGPITPAGTSYTFGNGGGLLFVRSNLVDVGGPTSVLVRSDPLISHNALSVVFQGANTYTGATGLAVVNSAAVLDSAGALPAGASFNLGSHGYVGYTEAFAARPTFASFLARLGSYEGSSIVGVDSHGFIATASSGGATDFAPGRLVTETIDLSGRSSLYLGTTTQAAIGGRVIAPSSGTLSLTAIGHGHLNVHSSLRSGDVSSVVVGHVQPVHEPGVVTLAGQNTFTGGTTLWSGSLLLGSSSRKPATTIVSGPVGTGTLTVGAGATAPVLSTANAGDTILHNDIALGSVLQIGFPTSNGGSESYSLASALLPESRLILNGVIGDLSASVGGLEVFTDLVLNGANTFSGGVKLHGGTLTLGSNSALGSAASTLTFDPREFDGYSPTLALHVSGPLTLANGIVFNGFSGNTFEFGGRGKLTVNGSVGLNGSVSLAIGNHPVVFNGNVGPAPSGGFGRLQVEGNAPLVLNGTNNTYGGGTEVNYGKLIFGSTSAIPAAPTAGLIAGYDGYIGLATPTATLQASFLDRFNKGMTSGTIGFDTPGGGVTSQFAAPISLLNFHPDARLGSASAAVLGELAVITPQASTYQFGGGGGLLTVNSVLANAGGVVRSVDVYSDLYSPLTLRLGAANSYTGGTTVGYSGLIFAAGALPATGDIYAYGPSYIGTEETNATEVATFLSRISSGVSGSTIIGFDTNVAGGSYTLGGTLNWPALDFGGAFLGTSTKATISAALTLGSAQTSYRFAGYKGGQLTVTSTLTDGSSPRSVQIGDSYNPATFRSPVDASAPMSTVTLSGTNSYTGGTLLAAGQLLLGHANALGTGALRVNAEFYDDSLQLPNATLGTTSVFNVPNAIVLDSTLTLGGPASFTLSGPISNGAEVSASYLPQLYKVGSTNVTLSGANTFTGGIYIAQGTVTFASPTAVGAGPLRLGGPLGPTASFTASSTVNGIFGDHALDNIMLAAGVTLTVNQTFHSNYEGTFSGTGDLVFRGPDAAAPRVLRLGGASAFAGSAMINSGIVVSAASGNAFGSLTNNVTLNGGTLALENGVTFNNPLTLTQGTLGGGGTFQSAAPLAVASNLAVAPALGSVGTLTFANGLSLLGGGSYQWHLLDAAGDAGAGYDLVVVNGTLNIAATADAPFNFRLGTIGTHEGAGLASNFDPNQAYSWTVLTATSITGFTSSAQFNLADTSAFLNSHYNGLGAGVFSVNVDNGTSLVLNFTPAAVPEPSTYAMIAVGLAIVGITLRRRRN